MPSPAAHIDFETRSTVDLTRSGVHRYAEHPSTRVLVMSWAIGDEPVSRWVAGEALPARLAAHIRAGGRVVAHNAAFERTLNNQVLRRDYPDWPELAPEQQDCTMARAQALALPADLASVAVVLGTTAQKDAEGRRLMLQMCKPRSVDPQTGAVTWWEDPERLCRLGAYCDRDVDTERDVDRKLPRLSDYERRVWVLDQTINDRGVQVDVQSAARALEAVLEARRRADLQMTRLTGGAVRKCTETARIVDWLAARGVPCVSIAKGEIEELILSSELIGDAVAEEVIRLRRAAAKTSNDKYKALLATVGADGRCRGMLAYHGASTGRWAGRGVQPQNFPRVDPDRDLPGVERVTDLLQRPVSAVETVDAIELMIGPSLEALSRCLRAMFVAAPGKKLVGADLSNIEGRVNAWLTGETWKTQAFRELDAGRGHDLYKLSYARSFGITPEAVSKAQRQIGKVQELALGYQGSVGAYVSMGAVYGIKPADVARVARAAASPGEWTDVLETYTKAQSRGLDPQTWTGVKLVVNAWRTAHPAIRASWTDLQDTAIDAVANPGLVVSCLAGQVQYVVDSGFLFCRLPSGRVIAYAAPRLVWATTTFLDRNGKPVKKRQVEYDGIDSRTRRWGPQRLYGGKQNENVVQAIARDLLADAMLRAEAAGFPIILTVHDEIVAEPWASSLVHDADSLEEIMTTAPEWARGLPLAAAAWEDARYVK